MFSNLVFLFSHVVPLNFSVFLGVPGLAELRCFLNFPEFWGCWEAPESTDIGSRRAAGVVWNIAGAGPSGFSEVPEKSWRAFGPVLELPGAFPATSRSSWRPLGEVGRRWIDRNNGLETPRSRWIDENSVLDAPRSRWIDKTSSFSDPSRRHGPFQPAQQRLSGTPPNHTISI